MNFFPHINECFRSLIAAIILVAICGTALPWGMLSAPESQDISWELSNNSGEESESDTEEKENLEGEEFKSLPQIDIYLFSTLNRRTAWGLTGLNSYPSPVLELLETPPDLQA